MRRWSRWILGAAMASAVTVGGAPRAYARPGDPTPVVHGGALVRLTETGDFAPASEGAAVAAGAVIRAGASRAVRLDVGNGVSVRLAPGAALVVRSMTWLPAEHPGATPVRALQVNLTTGEVDVVVHDPKGATGVTVLLPGGGSMALWRGSANVALDGEQAAIALYEGMAIAGSASKWQPLTAGKGLVLTPKGGPVTHAIPGPVEWSHDAGAPSAFALARGDEGGVVGASWSAARGASRYRVELARDAAMIGDVTVSSATAPVFRSEPLTTGGYTLSVRAVSPDGILGPVSDPMALRVAHVTVPRGGFVARDGNVVVPPSGALILDDPRDLEVATVLHRGMTDDSLFWAPATSRITLGTAARRDVRIRHVSSHTVTSFSLVPRTLRARVTFGPRHAHWPENPVDIVVKVDDPSGYLDGAAEAVDIDTRLGIAAMPVNWQRAGDTFTARVSPQMGPGPWVVRVDVKDSTGASIGASWLDVDGPAGDPSRQLQRASYRQ